MDANGPSYLDLVRQTRRCRPDVQAAAEQMVSLGATDFAALARTLIENAEDTALGILMNVCAWRRIVLDPEVLGEVLKVIEPITDFGPLLGVQSESAIAPLLSVALDEELSYERQAYAGLIAAELSVLHSGAPSAVRRVLQILEQSVTHAPAASMLLASAFALLEKMDADPDRKRLVSCTDIVDILPKERPPVVIGDGQTVRRPVPKIGRNAPCHCGSGKKYKKCCLERDQERIRDASAYEGLTSTEVRASPLLVDGTRMVLQMRAYELKKLDPGQLNADQLMAAYHRCDTFGLRELAFDMLQELDRRPDNQSFDRGHFVDLMHTALDAGELDLAQRIYAYAPDANWPDPDAHRLLFDLLGHRDMLGALEQRLHREMIDDQGKISDPILLRLSYCCEKTYPALALAFSRSFIAGAPGRVFDNEILLTVVRRARAEIGLDAWDDPIEDYVEWCAQKDIEELEDRTASEQVDELKEKLQTAHEKILQDQLDLQRREDRLKEMSAALVRKTTPPVPSRRAVPKPPADPSDEEKETIGRLRRKIESLKAEIGSQQQVRQQLRIELQQERAKALKPDAPREERPEHSKAQAEGVSLQPLKKVPIPEFTAPFRRSCEAIPNPIAAKALKAAAGFAAGDEAICRETTPIKRIPGCYRVRIGRSYRMLMHWKPEETLQVLDCIHRSELESWINRHCSG